MCGIWASIGFEPSPQTIDSVSHRGPHGSGRQRFVTEHGPLVLAHRRLSIIDLDARAAQPMSYSDGRYWLVYNGEIYNYIELREELERNGLYFTTSSDSEVLLAAYSYWGAACLERFNGMFAFVLFDKKLKRLFVARDRFGIKPLHVWVSSDRIAFASEIKQLLSVPGFLPRFDPDALHDFLHFGMTDHGARSFFSGVISFPAGHVLELELQDTLPAEGERVGIS